MRGAVLGFLFLVACRGPGPHVVFLVGESTNDSARSMPALAGILEAHYGMRCTVLMDEIPESDPANHIEGLETLADADLLVVFLRQRQFEDEPLQQIQAYLNLGRPVVGLRTSTQAFAYSELDPRARRWNAFGKRILGAGWKFHHGSRTRTRVTTKGDHPILSGVPDSFEVRSWLHEVDPHPDIHVLARGSPKCDATAVNPVAWTYKHPGGGDVFVTTLGHAEDFKIDAFRRLVVNGIHWALGREIPDRPVPPLKEESP